MNLYTYLLSVCMMVGALVTEAADKLIPEYPAAPTPVPSTYRMLGYNPGTSNYYTIPASEFSRTGDTNSGISLATADERYYPLNENPNLFTTPDDARNIAQYVLAGWTAGGRYTNTVNLGAVPLGSPGDGQYVNNNGFIIVTSPPPFTLTNSALLTSTGGYGIIGYAIPDTNISQITTYVTIQGPTNGGAFYAYLAVLDQCGNDAMIGTTHQNARSIYVQSNALNVYVFTNTFADALRGKRTYLWLGGQGGLVPPTYNLWITSWKVAYNVPTTMPMAEATLAPSLDWLNHSNMVVVCEGDSRTDWNSGAGLNKAIPTWALWMETMSWASNRCLLFTNFAMSSGVLDGTTNYFHGDPPGATSPPETWGALQRYSRFLTPIANTYPNAEKWILMMLPINEGFPTGYGASVTNYCNAAHADGWKVCIINTYPATSWGDLADVHSRNRYVARMYPLFDKLVDLASCFRTPTDSIMFSDGIHPTTLGSQVIAGIINSAMLDPKPMPWVQDPSWASPTTAAPTNTSSIAAWEDAIATDGSKYKRPLYR